MVLFFCKNSPWGWGGVRNVFFLANARGHMWPTDCYIFCIVFAQCNSTTVPTFMLYPLALSLVTSVRSASFYTVLVVGDNKLYKAQTK